MQRFEFSDGKSNKFWEIEISGCDLKVRYGRIGTTGQESTKTFGDSSTAVKERDKLIKVKTAKGYQPAEVLPLSLLELQHIANFLDSGGESFRDHSCNDFVLPYSEENLNTVRASWLFHQQNHVPEGNQADNFEPMFDKDKTNLFAFDYQVMLHLANRCQQLLEAAEEKKPAIMLTTAELNVIGNLLNVIVEDTEGWIDLDEGNEDFALPATDENKAFFRAAIENLSPELLGEDHSKKKILKDIEKASDGLLTFSFWITAYLAKRCHAVAGASEILSSTVVLEPPKVIPESNTEAANVTQILPSPNVKWLKRMKTWHKGSMREWYEESLSYQTTELEYYIRHGLPKPILDKPGYRADHREIEGRETSGSYMQWRGIGRHLEWISQVFEYEFEAAGTVSKGKFDSSLALRTFAARYLASVIELADGPATHPSAYDLPYMALGLILGCTDQALRVFRLRIGNWGMMLKYRNENVLSPINTLVLSIVADYLGIAPYLPNGWKLQEPSLQALIDCWRDPNPMAIVPHCVAACDFHSHVAIEGDLSLGQFQYFPFEILLVFKLRQSLGLLNPEVDHPIMNTPFGKLPTAIPFAYDGLLEQVYGRMVKEGFDEERIFGEYKTIHQLHALPNDLLTSQGHEIPNPYGRFPKPAVPNHIEFAGYHTFISLGFGITLRAPANWEDRSDEHVFRVVQLETNTEFSAIAYLAPDMSREKWGEIALGILERENPGIALINGPCMMFAPGRNAIGAEYRNGGKRVLALCAFTEWAVFLFKLTADEAEFVANADFFHWLLSRNTGYIPYISRKP